MGHRGERIKALRQSMGLDLNAVAEALGINNNWCWDLEAYDNEITDTLTLKQVMKLAEVLHITPRQLFVDEATTVIAVVVEPAELANRVKDFLKSKAMSLEEFEERVGWELAWFLDTPDEVWERPAMFLQALCDPIGINWLEVIPSKEGGT